MKHIDADMGIMNEVFQKLIPAYIPDKYDKTLCGLTEGFIDNNNPTCEKCSKEKNLFLQAIAAL